MKPSISNSVALVTGSNRGIGRALVQALLERGAAKVYAAARKVDALADLAAEHPGRVVPLALDVTDPAQVSAVAASATDVTLLVNNAGFLGEADLLSGDLQSSRQEFEVNYWGVLNVIRAFAPILKANGGGILANVSSVAGLSNFPLVPTYSDSKAANHSLTSGARLLLAAQNTRVVGIYPGPVATDMAKEIEMEKETPENVAAAILDGLENGVEDIFPDTFSRTYAEPYEAGHRTLENRIADMLSQPA